MPTQGLINLVPPVIQMFPFWVTALTVPSVWNAFPPDIHAAGSIIFE